MNAGMKPLTLEEAAQRTYYVTPIYSYGKYMRGQIILPKVYAGKWVRLVVESENTLKEGTN